MGECNGIVGWIDMPWIQHGVGGTMTKPWPCTTLPVSSSPCIAHHQQTFFTKNDVPASTMTRAPRRTCGIARRASSKDNSRIRFVLTFNSHPMLIILPASKAMVVRFLWPARSLHQFMAAGKLLNRIQKQIQLHRTAPAVPVRCIKQSTVNWNRVDYMKLMSIRSWWADEADEH